MKYYIILLLLRCTSIGKAHAHNVVLFQFDMVEDFGYGSFTICCAMKAVSEWDKWTSFLLYGLYIVSPSICVTSWSMIVVTCASFIGILKFYKHDWWVAEEIVNKKIVKWCKIVKSYKKCNLNLIRASLHWSLFYFHM